MSHHCCDTRHVSRTQCRSGFPQFWRCCGRVAPHAPHPKKDPAVPILSSPCDSECFNCRRCRALMISKRKRIALHGGVAATLPRVALHCPTKHPRPRTPTNTLNGGVLFISVLFLHSMYMGTEGIAFFSKVEFPLSFEA